MPNSNYKRGADFERRLKQEELDNGAILAVRAAGSHGLFDVVAVYPRGSVNLIQAKLGTVTRSERERLRAFAKIAPPNVQVTLATPEGREEVVG